MAVLRTKNKRTILIVYRLCDSSQQNWCVPLLIYTRFFCRAVQWSTIIIKMWLRLPCKKRRFITSQPRAVAVRFPSRFSRNCEYTIHGTEHQYKNRTNFEISRSPKGQINGVSAPRISCRFLKINIIDVAIMQEPPHPHHNVGELRNSPLCAGLFTNSSSNIVMGAWGILKNNCEKNNKIILSTTVHLNRCQFFSLKCR